MRLIKQTFISTQTGSATTREPQLTFKRPLTFGRAEALASRRCLKLRVSSLTASGVRWRLGHSLFLQQVLLLLPVRLDGVLRQELHELQGLLDFHQDLVDLATFDLRASEKQRERD